MFECFYIIIREKVFLGNVNNNFENAINIISLLADIAMIVVTFYIAYRGEKNAKKQDEKIEYDNKVNRLANFQSVLYFDKKLEIIIMNDSLQNWRIQQQYTNVLLLENSTECNYGIKIIYFFKNMTNVYPQEIFIKSIKIWDNTRIINQQIKSEQLMLYFHNTDNKSKSVVIDKDKNICIEALCCMPKDKLDIIDKYDKTDTIFNIVLELEIKNMCGLVSNCEIRGTFNIKERTDLSSGALGGNKMKVELENEKSYIKVIDIREEKNYE